MTRRSQQLAWAEPALLILHSLAASSRHGYAIVKDVEAHAGVTLGPGTLYAALSRLDAQGLVEALPGEQRRRPYRITAAGRVALHQRLETMSGFAAAGLARLAVGGA